MYWHTRRLLDVYLSFVKSAKVVYVHRNLSYSCLLCNLRHFLKQLGNQRFMSHYEYTSASQQIAVRIEPQLYLGRYVPFVRHPVYPLT